LQRQSLGIRYGQRHTRRREPELVSIACSTLNIRRRWVHVPHPFSPGREVMESGTVCPYRSLKLTWPSHSLVATRLNASRLCRAGQTHLSHKSDPIGIPQHSAVLLLAEHKAFYCARMPVPVDGSHRRTWPSVPARPLRPQWPVPG
jgi:hypothetical protein